MVDNCPHASGPLRDQWFLEQGVKLALEEAKITMKPIVTDTVNKTFKVAADLIRMTAIHKPEIDLQELADLIEVSSSEKEKPNA